MSSSLRSAASVVVDCFASRSASRCRARIRSFARWSSEPVATAPSAGDRAGAGAGGAGGGGWAIAGAARLTASSDAEKPGRNPDRRDIGTLSLG